MVAYAKLTQQESTVKTPDGDTQQEHQIITTKEVPAPIEASIPQRIKMPSLSVYIKWHEEQIKLGKPQSNENLQSQYSDLSGNNSAPK